MQKGIKFRIYPNREQKNFIHQTLGCCRFIYNRGLAMRKEGYENGEKIGYSQTSAMLTELKRQEEFAFLKAADSIALQQSLRDLDRGFVNFFQKRASYPTFKSKHNRFQSYRTVNQKDNIRIVGRYIKLPKLGFVKIRQSMEVEKINHVIIEHTPAGKYFAVLNVDFEPEPRSNAGGTIGIDVGIKAFYSDSNGNTVSNPRYLERAMRKLIREQRRLSRKQKGSHNRNRQRIRVARVHEKVTNQRNDFLQKQSTMLVRENQTICIEDLNVKGMIRNHKLSKSIASVSWAKFFEMLEYKAGWYGNEIHRVPTMYPSSQTCSSCGYRNPRIKNLSIRIWECPKCHAVHDRDTNAGINIQKKAQVILFSMLMCNHGNVFAQEKVASNVTSNDGNKKYNVLCIVADDLICDMGCFDDPIVKTPNLDKLRQHAVRFNNSYCQYPFSGPSRASFLTGYTPDRTGVLDLKTNFRDNLPAAVTLP